MSDETSECTKPFRLRIVHWMLLAVAVFASLVCRTLSPRICRDGADGRVSACASNLNQIARACFLYADAHERKFPDRISELYPAYIRDTKVFTCVVHGIHALAPDRIDADSDYVLVPGRTEDGSTDIIAYCHHPHPSGSASVMMGDGTVVAMLPEELQTRLKQNPPPAKGDF